MASESSTRVIVVGAGLAGSLLACCLGRRGFAVDVYERRPDPRQAGFRGGRSINLALSARGLAALEHVGLAQRVMADAVPMRGRVLHDETGHIRFQPYSADRSAAINSVSRGGLNLTLLEAAAQLPNVRLRFGCRALDVDLEGPGLAYVDEASGREERADGDLIVGADGAYSAVRRRLQMNEGFDYSQSYLEYGYKELCIPPAAGGGFALEPGGLHIWPRGGYMMIALPNRDGSFTCTLFWPYRGPESFAAVQTPREIEGFFRRRFPDAVPLMPTLVEDYLSNPVGPLVTIRCNPWHHGARAVLIGDAAHAIVPFFGQGMNAAFEDCQIFDGLIERCGPDWGRVLGAFSAEHRENAEAIADLALENFVEMRDRVSSPIFLARKRLGQILHRVFPRAFVPLYHMVSFSRIPYAEARRRARRQTLLLRAWLIAALAVAAAAAATWLIST